MDAVKLTGSVFTLSSWLFQPQQPLGPPCTHTKPFFTIPKANFQPLEPPVQPTEPNQPTCRTTKSAREKDNLRPNRQATPHTSLDEPYRHRHRSPLNKPSLHGCGVEPQPCLPSLPAALLPRLHDSPPPATNHLPLRPEATAKQIEVTTAPTQSTHNKCDVSDPHPC